MVRRRSSVLEFEVRHDESGNRVEGSSIHLNVDRTSCCRSLDATGMLLRRCFESRKEIDLS